MATAEDRKKTIEVLMKKNILIGPELLGAIDDEKISGKILELADDIDEEKIREILGEGQGQLKIISSHKEEAKKRSAEDFTSYFNVRYAKLKEMLQKKQEMQDALSIKRALEKQGKESVSIIGMIYDKALTKNNNVMLTLEDPTGQIRVVVTKNKADLFSVANDCVCDEVIGVNGVSGNKVVFANSIVLPEVPATNELKKGPVEEYAVFTGDQHVGASQFLYEKFDNFISWLNGETGSEKQKDIAKKVRYLFLVGDLVDGIGIHPRQYEELDIKSIEEQYSLLAEKLSKIPRNIRIIACGGNHDALRLIEPQPPLYEDYARPLYELPNVCLVSNPAVINIGARNNFRGFNVLLYHGMSFHFYAENVPSISQAGGAKRADLIMKFLLQRRHLAPEHTSVTSSPRTNDDPLLIDPLPDFFVTGHIHRSTVATYRNITLVNCSCWIGMTAFQEKVGLVPEPARAIAVNLKTRETNIIRF